MANKFNKGITRVSKAIKIVDGKYPNGTLNKTVFIGDIQAGTLAYIEDGFIKYTSWRKPIADLDAAIAKLRTEAVKDRQKQIEKLQREIEQLKD
jgi:hypothetical protein